MATLRTWKCASTCTYIYWKYVKEHLLITEIYGKQLLCMHMKIQLPSSIKVTPFISFYMQIKSDSSNLFIILLLLVCGAFCFCLLLNAILKRENYSEYQRGQTLPDGAANFTRATIHIRRLQGHTNSLHVNVYVSKSIWRTDE